MGHSKENSDVAAKQKAIDDWLPVTGSRTAKWWSSAFHNLTAMVGAGVLSLPFAMSNMGWGAGSTVLILSWVITLYTLWQMVEMHEMVPGKRFDRYSTIAWCASINKGIDANVDYGSRATSTADAVFNFFSALGDVAFAYAGHNVVLEIQATMPSSEDTPSKKPMWRGVILAYIGVAFCYLPVAFIGYYMFGNSVDDNILITLERPAWLIAAANLFVFVHVFAMPVFDMIETCMVTKLNFPPSTALRVTTRTIYVAVTMLIGICVPFFGSLLGFLGGFAFAPTSYFLPCIIWLKLKKPKKFGLSWTINWICIILGVVLMILSPIGALRNIILSAKNYKFFS
ncbi:Lysine histidine transporter 1 [Glycine soja]|uniref:Lysine histidine transporter 1 n=1 Tax=Glycine soja TaxID=3848 RepID=A0A445HI35_GLYSO|nr:Lysine histidine transporter 1 [Glycine soja]